jgi:hypothetical protein
VTSEHQVQPPRRRRHVRRRGHGDRLASDADKRLLVVDKHMHIGGNAYECRPARAISGEEWSRLSISRSGYTAHAALIVVNSERRAGSSARDRAPRVLM